MPRSLQRLTLAATVLLVAQAASDASSYAADPSPSPHEAAVLDRVFANWQARSDRAQSFHFTYDCRSTDTHPRLKRALISDQIGLQLFFDGDQRFCKLETPILQVPQAKPTDRRRAVRRWIINGDETWQYSAGSLYETGSAAGQSRKPYGLLFPRSLLEQQMPDLQALWLTFRPQFPNASWRRDQSRLVDENASIDNGRCVKIQTVVVRKTGAGDVKRIESLWVSPVRDDVVTHWAVEDANRHQEGTIRHKKDPKFGWVPSEWTCETTLRQPRLNFTRTSHQECRVTSYAINEKIDPAIFSRQFPPGTPVEDQRGMETLHVIRWYVAEPDGSLRTSTSDEYARLVGLERPAGKK